MRIPTIQASAPLGVQQAFVTNPDANTIISKAVGAMGANAQRIAGNIFEKEAAINEKFKEAENVIAIDRASSDFALYSDDLSVELDKDESQLERRNKFIIAADNKKAELVAGVKDEVLSRRIEHQLNRQIIHTALQEAGKGRAKENSRLLGSFEEMIAKAENRGDIAEVARITKEVVALGLATDSWMVKRNAIASEVVDRALITQQLSSNNAETLNGLISTIDGYKTLNPYEKAKITADARRVVELIQEKEAREEKERRTTNAYSYFKKSYGSNYDLMFQSLRDPAVHEKFKLTPEQAAQLSSVLKQEQHQAYNAVQDLFLAKLHKGTLTEVEVMRSNLPATGLGQGDKSWFFDMIKRRTEQSHIGFTHNNGKVYADIMMQILTKPETVDLKEHVYSKVGLSDGQNPTGITGDSALKFKAILESMQRPDPFNQRNESTKRASEALGRYLNKNMFVQPDDPEKLTKAEAHTNEVNYQKAVREFGERVFTTGEDPLSALDAVMKPYVMEKAFRFFNPLMPKDEEPFAPQITRKPATPKDKEHGKGKPPIDADPEKQLLSFPTGNPPGNKEGVYMMDDGSTFNWTKAKGWHQ